MAITYHAGRRIQGLSTDLESTTVTTTQLVWNTGTLTGYSASNSNRTLTKTASSAWNNSSAKSTASFTVGSKFSIEMSRDNLTASTMLGFSTSSSPSAGYGAAQFSMYMAGSYFQVYEDGSSVYNDENTGGSTNASDRYKIEVETDGTVKYYLDDGGTGTWVLQYTSSNTASGTYYINSSSYAQNSTATLGNSIVTVVNDLKPTNVQAGSRLEETDTRKMYHYGGVAGAITKDAQATTNTNSTGTTLTNSSFTVASNSNRILVVCAYRYSSGGDISGITWNGSEAFTRAKFQDGTTETGRTEIWYLVNPTATTASVVTTWDASTTRRGAGVYSFYNAEQTSPIGVTDDDDGLATVTTSTITPTTVGSMIVDVIGSGSNGAPVDTLTAGWTSLIGGDDRIHSSQYNLTPTIGSANTMAWTFTNVKGVNWIAVEIKSLKWSEEGT